jgi:hypothetical protein
MENGPLIDDFLINTSICKGFSMAMLNNQRVVDFLRGNLQETVNSYRCNEVTTSLKIPPMNWDWSVEIVTTGEFQNYVSLHTCQLQFSPRSYCWFTLPDKV